MTDLFSEIQESLKGTQKSIVLPEGTDERVLKAAARLQSEGLVEPILLGNEDEVKRAASTAAINIENISIIDPVTAPYFDELVDQFVERRQGKNTIEQAKELLQTVN